MGHRDRPNIAAAGLLLLSIVTLARGGSIDLQRAQGPYQRMEYRSALDTQLLRSRGSGEVHALIGQTCCAEGQHNKNSTACFERVIAEDSLRFNYYEWLGRMRGRCVEQTCVLMALSSRHTPGEPSRSEVAGLLRASWKGDVSVPGASF